MFKEKKGGELLVDEEEGKTRWIEKFEVGELIWDE